MSQPITEPLAFSFRRTSLFLAMLELHAWVVELDERERAIGYAKPMKTQVREALMGIASAALTRSEVRRALYLGGVQNRLVRTLALVEAMAQLQGVDAATVDAGRRACEAVEATFAGFDAELDRAERLVMQRGVDDDVGARAATSADATSSVQPSAATEVPVGGDSGRQPTQEGEASTPPDLPVANQEDVHVPAPPATRRAKAGAKSGRRKAS